MDTKKHFNSEILNTKYEKPDAYGSLSMPVYNTAAFEFESAEAMEAAFAGTTQEHTYSRISNPTVEYFEKRIKSITGAHNVTALSSGMAAISNVFFTLAQSGSNIVTSRHLFGNTYSFFKSTLAVFGVEVRFCDLTNLREIEQHIDRNTCALFVEIITNPQLEVADLSAISSICKQANIPLIADTTIIPFCAFKAADFGVDIEVVSSTKYISGGATSIGGLIVDYGTFDWSSSLRLGKLAKQEGINAFNHKLRKEILRNTGAYMSPQTAYLQSLGLETLQIRYRQASESTRFLTESLLSHSKIEKVNYPSLPENKFYQVSRNQFGDSAGAMFTIDLTSKEACFSFMNQLNIIRRATNLFDNQSLAIHPASTIYVSFNQEERDLMNISDNTIRFSIGLEEPSCLLEDIYQALDGI